MRCTDVVRVVRRGGAIGEPVAAVAKTGGLSARSALPHGSRDTEYNPHCVFDMDHPWRVRTRDRRAAGPFADDLGSREANFWTGVNPGFAASVHNDIFDDALAGMDHADLLRVKARSCRTGMAV